MKIIINILTLIFSFFCLSTAFGVREKPQPNKSIASSRLPNCCDRDKPNFWMPGCQPFYREGNFDGSIVETLDPPVIKQPPAKYIKEYRANPSFAYSAEYALPSGQKMNDSLTYREVDLKCIKKNGASRYCCTAIFPKAFGKDSHGIDRIIFQNTGIRCGYGETLRVEWITSNDKNEKAMEGLEKMGMIVKGKIIVRKTK